MAQRRTFKLLKDTIAIRKGALYQEQCDDGTQPYEMITPEFNKSDTVTKAIYHDRSLVEDQPQWFTEVFKVQPEYMTQAELDQWEAFKASQAKPKRVRKPAAKKAVSRTKAA